MENAAIEQARAVRIEDFLASRGIRLKGRVERAGPCPVCGGTDRFSINTTKRVFYCRQCDVGGDVIDLVRHMDGCDFVKAVETLTGIKPEQRSNGVHETFERWADKRERAAGPKKFNEDHLIQQGYEHRATYDYTDEDGELLYQVLRYEHKLADKTFRQRRPDGNGGWFGDAGQRKVLYRLPDLKRAVHNRAFVCEGEKDADRLASLGFVATTVAGGNWSQEAVEALRDRECFILEDNDVPGREKAEEVAGLLYGVAESVRVVRLPDLPDKGDVSDWLDAGGDPNVLMTICEGFPEWKPVRESDSGADKTDSRRRQRSQNGVTLEDFRAYMPSHQYIYTPTRELWPAGSVNSRIPPVLLLDNDGNAVIDKNGDPIKINANAWIDRHQPVEQMTWCPGLPMLIEGRLVSDGGWIPRHGVTCFNLFRPPQIEHGDAAKAGPWIDHVSKVFPDDASHLIQWFSHRVQRPHEKINHAIVLGGDQGIGKDTILEPVKRAVGPWNFQEVTPQQMLGRFNGFLKSVILRLSEARDLGDINRYQFYDHVKAYLAAPPDVLRIDEKHLREYGIFNVVGVVITTNHKADGIYLPPDDRRHYVAWSGCKRDDFDDAYWSKLWQWYEAGGNRHVAAYLSALDLSSFNPKAPPPKTNAFWDIVGANQAPEDAELRDILDRLGNPDATTIERIARAACPCGEPTRGSFAEWINDRKNRRVIPHRLEDAGYVPVRNRFADDGLWKIGGKRQAVYAKRTLSDGDKITAAARLR